MTTKKILLIVGTIAILGMLLTACSGSSSPYSLHTATEYGVTIQRYIPEKDLSTAELQLVLTLPGGNNPDVKWVTHNSGCQAFALNDANPPLVTMGISSDEGTQYPSDRHFQISCPTGARIWWERPLPVVVSTEPAK